MIIVKEVGFVFDEIGDLIIVEEVDRIVNLEKDMEKEIENKDNEKEDVIICIEEDFGLFGRIVNLVKDMNEENEKEGDMYIVKKEEKVDRIVSLINFKDMKEENK